MLKKIERSLFTFLFSHVLFLLLFFRCTWNFNLLSTRYKFFLFLDSRPVSTLHITRIFKYASHLSFQCVSSESSEAIKASASTAKRRELFLSELPDNRCARCTIQRPCYTVRLYALVAVAALVFGVASRGYDNDAVLTELATI